MKKFYEKKEVLFAVLWIIVYCVVSIPIRGSLGDESPVMLAALAAIAAGIIVFVKKMGLEEKYGLVKFKGRFRDYWFFIPMLILMTGNLWGGFSVTYNGIYQVFAVLSMLLIGFIEEMIFRGFLFRAILKKDPAPVAITITAVTFGIGHIVNLFAGQANHETVIQIFFAVAWGFIFTFVFYKSGSLIICVIVHGIVNALSMFAAPERLTAEYVYMFATIGIAVIYCIWLGTRQTVLLKEYNSQGK